MAETERQYRLLASANAAARKKDLQSQSAMGPSGQQAALFTHVLAIDYVPQSHYPAVKNRWFTKLPNQCHYVSQVRERGKEFPV